MATQELADPCLNEDHEAQSSSSSSPSKSSSAKRGGWVTFPFISGNLIGMSIAQSGVILNLMVYLINQFNINSIDAAQIYNIINGCSNIAPLIGAIVADSCFGCFTVAVFSTFVSFLGMILFTLSASVGSLRPASCITGSATCSSPSASQYAVLFLAVALISIGNGGTRLIVATMGANQFDHAGDQDVFFNWYFFVLYMASIVGTTVIVYVQDSVSWGLGFGLCSIANAIGFIVLKLGTRYYRRLKPAGSPFIGLARVVVASVRKSKMRLSSEPTDYYYYIASEEKPRLEAPSRRFRFFNHAALKKEGDTNSDGSIARPWQLCTVQQVEDLKTILKILPLWCTCIFISISISIMISLTVAQALTVDRTLGRHFSVPAGSLNVAWLAIVALVLPLLDRTIYSTWCKLTGHTPTPLQRIGLGHVFNMAAIAAAALVEDRRLGIVHAHHLVDQTSSVVPMSVMWFVVPLMVMGLGEALHFPGQVALYYQEFPVSLRSTATGMVALLLAVGYYMSTVVVGLVRRSTNWLPGNINVGRLDKMYWMLMVVGVLNFSLYVLFAKLYKYKKSAVEEEEVIHGRQGSELIKKQSTLSGSEEHTT